MTTLLEFSATSRETVGRLMVDDIT